MKVENRSNTEEGRYNTASCIATATGGAGNDTVVDDLSPSSNDNNDEEASSSSRTSNNRCYCCDGMLKRSSRPLYLALLVILLGIAATAAFLALGIPSAFAATSDDFEDSATELIQQIEIAFKDYEGAALWTQQACSSNPTFTHEGFWELYEHMVSLGIDAQIEYMPNVTHPERRQYENRSREYYSREYPYVNYTGFTDFDDGGIIPVSEHPFYFPIHFVQPVVGSEVVIDLDVYSMVYKANVDKAIETYMPVLDPPVRLIAETEEHAYSVGFWHPGIPLSTQPDLHRSKGIGLLVIRIPDLIRRATKTRTRSTSIYLYDTTDDELFLGAADIRALNDNPFRGNVTTTVGIGSSIISTQQGLQDEEKTFTLLAPIPLDEIRKKSRHIHEETIATADREWTIAVVAVDGTYEPTLSFQIAGGLLLLFCTFLISAWVYSIIKYSNLTKEARLRRVKSAAQREKDALILSNVRETARVERRLNEFIAHEVRNPIAAAISACSFVKAAVSEPMPLQDETSQTAVREDVEVIDKSLNFVNTLLRDMLDMQKASNDEIKIVTRPTDIYNDVFKFVDSMLYRRGNSRVEVQICCNPQNLIVDTDPLRLKQVMLNLGRNSCKFVEKGFVRLTAHVLPSSAGHVQLSVEDSGPGIPAEKREHLFDKYQESLDTLSQGTGIGLHLCQKLVELMGGDIWLDEDYDSGIENYPGSRFVVDLNVSQSSIDDLGDNVGSSSFADTAPASLEQGGGNGASAAAQEQMGSSLERRELPETLSVLFVDDDTTVRKLFSRAVKRVASNWTVREASNGETALKFAVEEQIHFDLIFMDMYMASVEKQLLGTETVRELRAKGIKSIICGVSANDMEEQFLEAGADAFMLKPFPCQKAPLEVELQRILWIRGDLPLPPIRRLSMPTNQENEGSARTGGRFSFSRISFSRKSFASKSSLQS